MSNPALSITASRTRRQRGLLRRQDGAGADIARFVLPWSAIPLGSANGLPPSRSEGTRHLSYDAVALIAAVLVVHAALAWYGTHRPATPLAAPAKQEINIALERPNTPPKIEPPKPPPPKPPRPARVLPEIQHEEVAARDAPPLASPEPPVAVEPVVSAPPPPPPPPVTPPIGRAGYLNNPAPAYPPVAARLGLEGIVLLRVKVLSSGKVESVTVQKSSGSQPLDEAALVTVKKWLFTPSKRGDTPIDGWATVPIEFKLDQ